MNPPCRLPGRRRHLRLLLVLGFFLAPLLASVPARADDNKPAANDPTPLTVHLVRLTPATFPAKGKVVLVGSVTNSSDQTWTGVNVHPFISRTPMTTRDELAAAAATDQAAEVGTRLIEQDEFATVGDLAPGKSASFRIALKVQDLRALITGDPGVYWFGVHALGQNAQGGARETLGRARTFLPLVRTTRTTPVAIVVPVREQVRRDRDGRVLGSSAWANTLAPTGRLGRLASFLASAGTHPTTVLLDPAVLDAVKDLKDDNPTLSLGSTETGKPDQPSASPTDSPSRSSDRLDPAERANAGTWLDAITASARTHTTLGLGYADPDVSALVRRRPAMLTLANKLAAQTFASFDIAAVPTVAPPNGYFDGDLLSRVPAESTVLISDHSAPRTRTRWRTAEHQDLVFTDTQASSGGPAPTDPTDTLALRQRILSDAALRLPEGSSSPLVVELPDSWDPGVGWQLADFFDSLDQPWLDLVSLNPTTDATTPTFGAALAYPASARRSEVPGYNVQAARTLIQTTTVVAKTLRSKNTLAHDLAGIAFDAVSYHAADDQLVARQQVLSTSQAMRTVLEKVQVIGTDFVTLSGGSGTLAVTLVNGLDQPVVVGVKAQGADKNVTIDSVDPVQMAPGQRVVLRLHADSGGVGVDQVVLSPVTVDGTPIGTPLSFRLRTSQVGKVVWGVLGAGAVLLVVMIARRIVLRVRNHRWRRA